MDAEERREFVERHRTCVFGYQRKDSPPSMSIVYYTMDGDDLLISTMAGRAKAKAVERLGEVSICVLDEQWPLTYLVIYGKARVERDLQQTGTVMMKVGEIMSGNAIPEAARPMVYTTALLLLAIVLVLNLTAIVVRNQLRKKYATSAF